MTTVASLTPAIDVLTGLLPIDGALPVRGLTLTPFSGGVVLSVLLSDLVEVQQWGDVIDAEHTERLHNGKLHCTVRGTLKGVQVEAFCILDDCPCGKPASHLAANEDSAEWACLVPQP